MDRQRWQLIDELYHAALEHDPGDRKSFLSEASPDEGVRREVESLLRFDEAPDTVLDVPAWECKMSPGDRIGPYEILERIGRGGMGEVWKARDSRLGRMVAIKSPVSRFSDRIEREARAIAALNHPHICAIYDVGPAYLVMEYVEGSPLRGPLPLLKAVEYAGQILDALDAAHSRDIVHRDLKPANILVTKTGVKLVDFGLAKWAHGQPADLKMQSISREGVVAGTPEYMAPEQARGDAVDSRADIFAFGCVFYEMLTGKRHTDAASINLSGASPLLERIWQRCLEPNPEHRWQSARDVNGAITLVMNAQPMPTLNRRRWIAVASSGAVLGGAAGAGSMAWMRRSNNSSTATPVRVDISPPRAAQFPTIGIGTTFALAPDGRSAACVVNQAGKIGLWLRPFDGTPARMLTETGISPSPFWSADGKFVAFESRSGGLERVDIRTGNQWTVCEPGRFVGGSWNVDGQILLGGPGVLRVPASGGIAIPITSVDRLLEEQGHLWPQALPGGKFLYLATSASPGKSAVYAASLAKPNERTRLIATDTNVLFGPGGDGTDYLVWYRDGNLIAQEFNVGTLSLRGDAHEVVKSARVAVNLGIIAALSANGSLLFSTTAADPSSLAWFSREGRLLGTVGEPAEYLTCRLSPDGRRIAASRSESKGPHAIWILDSDRETAVRFGPCDFGGLSAWSPDGQVLAYSLLGFHLVRQPIAGGGKPEVVTTTQKAQLVNDWSRDGRFILYQEAQGARGFDVMAAEIGSDGKILTVRSWLSTPYHESDARFIPTPDPHWIAYMSDETGRYEIFIDSFPEPGRKTPISINGGRFAQWRRDGRELYFLSADYKLMAVSVKASSNSIETSAPRELFRVPAAENLTSPYEAAPDGQRFLVRMAAQQSEPLALIINWPALMKGQAPR